MLPLRALCRNGPSIARRLPGVQLARFSSSGSNVIVAVDDKTGVATMQLNKKPVNSLNLEMLTDICINLEKLEKTAKGIILTSAVPNIFSAGLDILEMYQPKPERLPEFWKMVQEMWIKLYGCQLPVIAAINGHSPAGGCLMSICADYRIMAQGNYTIGLNETKLGIVAPTWFKDTFVNTVGHRVAEGALQQGTLFSSEQALKVGLVDELVPMDQVQARAETQMKSWLKVPGTARATTKSMMRQETIDKLLKKRQEDIDMHVVFITSPPVQKMMGIYMENLQKKSAK